jgi:eukaryotic-like serine/threonine-protein kinase
MVGPPARDEVAPRYETILRLAAGGMATVYVGTVRGALGFRQLVAIKKPHPHLLQNGDFRQELLTEARLASLLHHAHVVDVRDVEATSDGVSLIMEYVEGAPLGELLQIGSAGGPAVTPGVAVRVVLDACTGLQAAHELCDERGRPLHLVHRDISPQNLLVGVDGITRVADFGVAKFDRKTGQATTGGALKGKLAYMAPEYLRGEKLDRRFDVFGMGVVLWEALTCQRLFRGESEADTFRRVLEHAAPPVSSIVPALGTALDAIVETALAKSRDQRFDNAAAMANALESSARAAGLVAAHREVAELVVRAVGGKLEERRARIRDRLSNEPSVASAIVDPAVQDPAPDTTVEPTRSPALTDRSPGVSLPATLSADALAAKPVPTTLKSEPALGTQAAPAVAIPATSASSASSAAARPSRYLAFVLIGGLLVAGAAVAALREWRRTPSDATTATVSNPPLSPAPASAASASLAAEPTPAATPLVSVDPPRPAPTTSPRAHGPRPHRAIPTAAPAQDSDPPPNPYASP